MKMGVNQSGHVVITDSAGKPGGIFVKNSDDNGVHIVHPQEDTTLKEAAGQLDPANGVYSLEKGDKFGVTYGFDNSTMNSPFQANVGKSAFQSQVPGLNTTVPAVGADSAFASGASKADMTGAFPSATRAVNELAAEARPRSMFNTSGSFGDSTVLKNQSLA